MWMPFLQVYDFVVVRNGQRLITGSADSELRVWDINYLDTEVYTWDENIHLLNVHKWKSKFFTPKYQLLPKATLMVFVGIKR